MNTHLVHPKGQPVVVGPDREDRAVACSPHTTVLALTSSQKWGIHLHRKLYFLFPFSFPSPFLSCVSSPPLPSPFFPLPLFPSIPFPSPSPWSYCQTCGLSWSPIGLLSLLSRNTFQRFCTRVITIYGIRQLLISLFLLCLSHMHPSKKLHNY